VECGGEGVVAVGEVEWSGEVLCVSELAVKERLERAEEAGLEVLRVRLGVDVVMVVVGVAGRTRDIAYPKRFKTSRRCGQAAVGCGLDDRRCEMRFWRHCELIDLVGSVGE
jgi:hypothetical protein